MSQSSVPWADAAINPCLPSIEQETYTQEQLEEAFAQTTSDEPVFTPVFNDDLDDFDFSIDNTTDSHTTSADASTSSTPDFSGYTFTHPPSTYHTAPSTPQTYPIDHHQTQPTFHHRPLPFRAQPTSPVALPHPPQGHDRRRSLSHSAIDRPTPPHPTFLRLQGAQAPRIVSHASGDPALSGPYIRHGRSVSQGASAPGRRLKNTVPYSQPGSPLVGATHIGTPIEDGCARRKRVRRAPDQRPWLARVTDAAKLRRSRHIIEVGAMAVRRYGGAQQAEGGTPHQRVVGMVRDVEGYLKREGGGEDALRACGVVREALESMGGMGRGGTVGEVVSGDDADVPSKMMDTEDGDIFGGCLSGDGIMGLLMRENDVLGGERADV